MVRPGIMLYRGDEQSTKLQLDPVVELQAPILQVKDIHKGESIGYGASYTAQSDLKIALVELGYADGFPWSLKSSNDQKGGQLYIDTVEVPILGRISMDIIAIDISHVEKKLKRGDFVQVIGEQQTVSD